MSQESEKKSSRRALRAYCFGLFTMGALAAFVSEDVRQIWPTVSVKQVAVDPQERMITSAFQALKNNYATSLTDEDVHAFIEGGLSNVDFYSGYLPDDSYRALVGQESSNASQAPLLIGVLGMTTQEGYIVETTVPNSPADRAGLRPGDILKRVNGTDVSDISGQDAFETLLSFIQDNPGFPIDLTFARGVSEIERTLVPAQIPPTYVFDLGPKEGVPHIVVSGFYPGATQTLHAILSRYKTETGSCDAILDLRSNPGGLVTEVATMASLFAPPGVLIYATQSRILGEEKFYTTGTAPFEGCKIATIINADSASAAEILAAFFQGNGIGQVVGQVSYGKGSVQTVAVLDPPGSGAVRVTMGHYTDASGREIEGIGVMPDIVIEHEDGEILERKPRGVYDRAVSQAASWVSSQARPGDIPSAVRPSLFEER